MSELLTENTHKLSSDISSETTSNGLLETTPEPLLENSDTKLRKFRKKLQDALEIFFRWLFFWEIDDKRIGLFIRVLHQYLIMFLVISYLIVHTILPNYFYLFSIWFIAGIIWSLHCLTGSCVLTKIEQKLIDDKITVADPFLDIFHIPKTKENIMGVTLMTSTAFFLFLSFELLARTVLNIKSYIPNFILSSFF
jgi:hypothetical protein